MKKRDNSRQERIEESKENQAEEAKETPAQERAEDSTESDHVTAMNDAVSRHRGSRKSARGGPKE